MKNNPKEAYLSLEKYFEKIADVERAIELLNWDRAVMMPATGAEARSEQLATLTSIKQDLLATDIISELIFEAASKKDKLTQWQQANLREIKKYHTQARVVPRDLLKRLTYITAKCETLWETAKKDNDFSIVANELEEVRKLTIEKANAISSNANKPYDVMLDQYNSGCVYDDIEPIFAELERWLPNFLDDVLAKQKETVELPDNFPINRQKKLARYLAGVMGYSGRIDESSHPFSVGRIGDVRITNRYNDREFILYSILCILHEAGHGLYDMQLPKEWRRQPVGGAFDISMAIHESQSMIWEMQIGHMIEFWEFITPKAVEILKLDKNLDAYSPENLCAISNKVSRGHIRVDADEVTYPLHIIIRTKLEKAMIENNLSVYDLPEAWRSEAKNILGIEPPNDSLGCMQDVHWYGGCFGYFPAYLLGAMNAAQIFHKMSDDIDNIGDYIRSGEFICIKDWLREKIHKFGCLYQPKELIYKATGSYLDINIYKNHLENRYLA